MAEFDGVFKLIWEQITTVENKWKSVEDFDLIKNEGEFVQALKLEAPEDENNLKHYNSF